MGYTENREDNIEVSVWCTAYNHEKYIRSALEGFVKQKTNFRFEVIVHEDVSSDNTAGIIREYEEKYPDIIKPIYQTVNQYQFGAEKIDENFLAKTRGKYIAMCEGDDFWCDENKLQRQYDILKNNNEVSICVHKVWFLNEDGSETDECAPDSKARIVADTLFESDKMIELLYTKSTYPFHTSSYFVKREVLESENCSYLRKWLNGDVTILYSALLEGQVYYIDKVMSCRRLLTIGNYNNRLLKMPIEDRCNICYKIIDGENEFDKVSGYRFHTYVVEKTYSRIFSYAQQFGKKYFYEIYDKYKKENKFPWISSWRLSFRHILFLMPEGIEKFVKRIYDKYMNK